MSDSLPIGMSIALVARLYPNDDPLNRRNVRLEVVRYLGQRDVYARLVHHVDRNMPMATAP